MCSKGSRFTLGVWGLSCVRQTLRNRSQTVRNCPGEDHMAAPMASSAKGVTFGAFQRRIASFRVAGMALCDISTCCMTWQRSFCVAGAALWRPPMSFWVALHFTLSTSHSTLYTLHCTPHTLHCTLHFTLYTLHFTLHTLHFTLHTLHSTLYT